MSRLRLYLWPHRLLLLGPGFDTGWHRHHAAQICFGLDGPLRLRTQRGATWDEHGGFYVPPDEQHEFAATATPTAIIYVEAESAEFAALQASLAAGADVVRLAPGIALFSRFRQLAAEGGAIDEANAACLDSLSLGQSEERRRTIDARIARSLHIIRSSLDQPLRVNALAATLNVSESWLMHRFTSEVGVPIRRYVLWQRLRRAVEAALKGATLTAAAHAAGFSDSAHLSRTFRETFGVAPSFLFEDRDQLDVVFAEA